MKVCVIGSGPAGLTSAIMCARRGHDVTILEKNDKIGKKLLMTGNGKCNYFNSDMDISHYHSLEREALSDIINEKNINEALSFLQGVGIFPTIKNGYFYPRCNRAAFVVDALYEEVKLLNIHVRFNFEVISVIKEDKFIVKSLDEELVCDRVILGTGSKAYPITGSDGKGYDIALSLDHDIVKPLPSLVPLVCKGDYFNIWKGSRSEATVSLYENGEFVKEEKGEVQFTDYGISGICVFNLSCLVTRGLDSGKTEEIFINFLPWLKVNSIDEVKDFLITQSNIVTGRKVDLFLQSFVDEKIVRTILKVTSIDGNKYFDELSGKEKYRLAESLFSFKIEVVGSKGFEYGQVCSGGVSLEDINFLTMESKMVKGLYIVGELLDVNGDCGGYNLAFAFISGMLCGKGI